MSLVAMPFKRLRAWFNPNDPDPRNRTLRYLSVGILIASILGLAASYFIYEDASLQYLHWVLISFIPGSESILRNIQEPLVNGVGLYHTSIYIRLAYIAWPIIYFMSIASALYSAWLTRRGQLKKATYIIVGWCLVVAVLILLLVDDEYTEELLPQLFMILALIGGFLLTRRTIWPMFLLLVILSPIIVQLQAWLQGSSGWSIDYLLYMTSSALIVLSIVSLLVYGFRVEFDARANAWEKARLAELEQERLRELDKVKTDFLYSMSHELRTPLHSIIGLSSGILNGIAGEIDDELRIDIETISVSGKHLLGLVNEVLNLAKLESGSIKLEKQTLPIVGIVNEAVRIVQPQAQTKGLTFVANVSADLPPSEVDSKAIHQVMLNLLNNAIKFTEHGTVQVDTMQKDNAIVVRVKDSGIGIPQEYQENLFNKFYQVAGEHKKHGTGLGLAISKRLIELHNGNIWVESTTGQGSSFYFSLPIVN